MNNKNGNKAKVNYVVDLVIGVGFVVAALSGIALLLIAPGGYRGGHSLNSLPTLLSMSRWTWKAVHDWGAIAMAGGVALHLVLHWKWLVCMTRKLFTGRSIRAKVPTQATPPRCESPDW